MQHPRRPPRGILDFWRPRNLYHRTLSMDLLVHLEQYQKYQRRLPQLLMLGAYLRMN